ncbi:MAG: hypothetical protein WAT71_15255 [Ignavibacteria bacterium]
MPVSYFINKSGLIKASGTDLTDFLNRMSTNDFRSFHEGEFRYTVLTSDKGRIIDLVNFVNFGEEKFLICTSGFEEKIIEHLDKYIIMDDVKLEKAHGHYSKISIFTNEPETLSSELFNIKCEKDKAYKINEKDILFFNDGKINTLNIICEEKHVSVYRNLMKDITGLSFDEYEFKRISNHIPEGENELNDQINPMECGLEKFISFKKGCYIGQEVIARIDSQGKIPKSMVSIVSDNEFNRGDKVFNSDNKKEVGFISSVIKNDDKYYGLAFLRRTELDGENKFYIEREGNKNEINILKKEIESEVKSESN